MKKFMVTAFAALMLILVSCAGKDADSVAKKISSGDKLEQADYTVMLDYCDAAFKELAGIVKAGKLDEKTAGELDKKYNHLDAFMNAISSGLTTFDAENKKKFNSLMQAATSIYEDAFTAPNIPVDIDVQPDSVEADSLK